ncbi:MAG: hypothetical protein OXH00_07180 [Candidatus Poribacteria bacterium]|nr:hypothetical protein [Candidatus Poribacteria bacterium]
MFLKTNALITKRSKLLLGVFIFFNMCVFRFASGPVEAVSGGLVAVGILVLMIMESKIGMIVVGSLIVGSGSFLFGHMLGRLLG